jgi:hypothetical protein
MRYLTVVLISLFLSACSGIQYKNRVHMSECGIDWDCDRVESEGGGSGSKGFS